MNKVEEPLFRTSIRVFILSKTRHLWVSFPPRLSFSAVNDALHRLPPFSFARAKNPSHTETSANVQKYTRVSTVKVNDNDAVTFTEDTLDVSAAGNSPTGTITLNGTTGTVTITNTYTKEKTEISGTKTWVDKRTHDNAREIILKL